MTSINSSLIGLLMPFSSNIKLIYAGIVKRFNVSPKRLKKPNKNSQAFPPHQSPFLLLQPVRKALFTSRPPSIAKHLKAFVLIYLIDCSLPFRLHCETQAGLQKTLTTLCS